METKDTRLNAALETTKQLLVRAEQREERIVQIYDQASGVALARRLPCALIAAHGADSPSLHVTPSLRPPRQMLSKVATAWSKRQRSTWLSRWAWSAIIKGSGLGWCKYHAKSCTAFLNFIFLRWRDLHRANIRKGGRVLMLLWRRDLQCLTRTIRAWVSKSQQRQRRLRFYYVRSYQRCWHAFSDAVLYSRRTRRAATQVARKSEDLCLRRVMRDWSQTAWRQRTAFWRRHCRYRYLALPAHYDLPSHFARELKN
jgi:hypothetical protein